MNRFLGNNLDDQLRLFSETAGENDGYSNALVFININEPVLTNLMQFVEL